ncbi:winged helix DNA-binding domain-containing protein [Arthrobacter sp. U41]|uniref:winged helix DNA-binding domain-containing protein n=1 Tax=Arthrobacter sp. U41 TaxID=1849032 RepID=UPI00085941A5|nr:winged helix DNA-binding domain-containing protein [Arthrobacter sp. U41]AOT02575.1 hypothetical protein ASPU41_03650 [Arthrobacter sp. U41]
MNLTAAATWRQRLDSPVTSSAESMLRVVRDTVGLHSTLPGTPYLSLNARIGDFTTDDLDIEVYEHRSLVRLKVMRGTVFLLTRDLAQIAFAAIVELTLDRDRKWLRIDPGVYRRVAPVVLNALGQESLTASELRIQVHHADLSAVVALLCEEARIVRDRPARGRTSTSYRYRRWDQAFPDLDLAAYDGETATDELIRRYIASYGPVSVADVVWWTGLPAKRVWAALGRVAAELQTIDGPLAGHQWLKIGDTNYGQPLPRGRTPRVRLLPQLDPYTMGYRDRERLIDAEHEALVYDRGGNVTSVVLQDGRITGVWDLTESPTCTGRVMLFDPASAVKRQVLDLVAETGAFWFGHSIPVREYVQMVPFDQRTGVMRKPLDGATPAA